MALKKSGVPVKVFRAKKKAKKKIVKYKIDAGVKKATEKVLKASVPRVFKLGKKGKKLESKIKSLPKS